MSDEDRRVVSPAEPAHRAGVVALVGLPNAGKSSLLNALVGEKLAIVSTRPQTTRSRVLGIRTDPGSQILFTDTPGLHEGEKALHAVMHDVVRDVIDDCDIALLVVDPGRRPEAGGLEERAFARLSARRVPVIGVASKSDLGEPKGPWPPALGEPAPPWFRVSARTGAGVEELLAAVRALLPEGPALFPEDDLTDRPLRWLAGELVREAAFECLHAELPYAVAVEILSFDESRPDGVRIEANLVVERDSQKRIAVGAGGEMVKRIGTRARHAIEELIGGRAHLSLRVKVEPGWTRKRTRVESFGYR